MSRQHLRIEMPGRLQVSWSREDPRLQMSRKHVRIVFPGTLGAMDGAARAYRDGRETAPAFAALRPSVAVVFTAFPGNTIRTCFRDPERSGRR
jgi:hypothetical protein